METKEFNEDLSKNRVVLDEMDLMRLLIERTRRRKMMWRYGSDSNAVARSEHYVYSHENLRIGVHYRVMAAGGNILKDLSLSIDGDTLVLEPVFSRASERFYGLLDALWVALEGSRLAERQSDMDDRIRRIASLLPGDAVAEMTALPIGGGSTRIDGGRRKSTAATGVTEN
jgi:hypothetical protein